ncbi:hypothetical protein QJ857_gp0217 [Tupanvirus soda lake]|uniref:Uncharacterized protein n=1 Tax=Tupanvirus deep ocean TaxID=2126984 RepID=A0AC59HCB8_9VIRU|nr:hypothetical protein QJ857_gp0217 [Tupanvirus soda lake]AUL78669.2 hypothetical protein [Tupanvirus soda lake]
MTTNKKISQMGIFLSRRAEVFNEEKKYLMNQPKMIEYLFNKPMRKINCLRDLLQIDYDSTIKTVRMEKKDTIAITSNFFLMSETLKRYSAVYQIYEKNTQENHHIKFDYLPSSHHFSLVEQTVMKILDKYEYKYKISYLYKWNFMTEGEHLVLTKQPTINFELPFVFDFYGILINHGQMVQFVIECDFPTKSDNNNHTQNKHITDIIKQYILLQMNINLLRINPQSNIEKEIVNFMRKIKNTTKYIIQNPIKPAVHLFDSKTPNDDLEAFCKDYDYNHVVYLKIPNKKNTVYDSDDDEFFEQQQTEELCESGDSKYVVDRDIFLKILKEKEDFHSVKHSEADNIIVELLKSKS